MIVTWGAEGRAGDAPPTIRAGERWRLALRLNAPHGLVNPHGFDTEAWMFERNLRVRATVRVGEDVHQRLARDAGRWQDRIERMRENTRERMLRALGDARWSGVLVALALGDQASIPDTDWTTFNAAGISHLLSISGAHVTLFAAALAALVFNLWRRVHGLTLRLPARKAAAVVAVTVAGLYAAFAGFAVPAQRTFFMLTVVAFALARNVRLRPDVVLALALAVVLVLDPWAVLSAGFWFSFFAVAVLMWCTVYRSGHAPWWRIAGHTQIAVTVALAPIAVALFQQFSIVGVLVNVIAIPVVSFVVVPLTLLWMLVPWPGLLSFAHAVVTALAALCEWSAALPLSVWQQHAPPTWAVVVAIAGGLLAVAPRGFPAKVFAPFFFVPLLFASSPRPAVGTFTVTALDVGQGQAVVVHTHRFDLIYDAGPRWSDAHDAGQRVVAPYLRATGAPGVRLGAMIVSHEDSDHAGGMESVLKERRPDWVMTSFDFPNAMKCNAGQRWTWDGVRFEIVHPEVETGQDSSAKKSNDLSCVLRIAGADGATALLTGDIEVGAETRLVASGRDIRAALMTMPHHGSRTSSSAEFIDAVAPAVVVVNAGYRNQFGHPRADVLEKYLRRNIQIDRTDLHGAVRYVWQDQGWQATRWRDVDRRYWRHSTDVRK